MGETRSTDFATVGPFATVTDDVNTHFTFRCFNSGVRFTRRDRVSFCEKEEVMDKRFHVLLHGSSGWWGDLVILHTNRACWHLVQALMNDTKGLAELLHAAKVSVITISIDTNGDVEFYLAVGIVGLGFADVPWNAGTTEHDSGKTVVEGLRSSDHTNALGASFPYPIVCE